MTIQQKRLAELLIPILLALGSLSASAWVGYSNNDKDISNRVTAVEERQKDDRDRLQHIEVTVDKIYDKVAGW